LTLDASVTTGRSGVKCVVTDPIDLDISLQDAFLRCAEKHLAFARNFDGKEKIAAIAEDALFRAKCADGRVCERRVAGCPAPIADRLRNFAIIETEES